MTEIYEKWGFGLAPPKAKTQAERELAVTEVVRILEQHNVESLTGAELVSLSVVKGMFNRIYRQDQWDWFTVCGQCGYPSGGISEVIAEKLDIFRRAFISRDFYAFREAFSMLTRLPTRKCLGVFLGRRKIKNEEGAGWIYILSTREFPDLLKIGMTTRTVEERVREINAATGVAIPFGIRSCWRVKNPAASERLVHARLAQYRMRTDREFFRVDWVVARAAVAESLLAASQELRTLDALTSLGDEA